MCVIKIHAFIYFLRPPPWYGTGQPSNSWHISSKFTVFSYNHIFLLWRLITVENVFVSRIFYGTSCPWRKSSRRRVVYGRSCPWCGGHGHGQGAEDMYKVQRTRTLTWTRTWTWTRTLICTKTWNWQCFVEDSVGAIVRTAPYGQPMTYPSRRSPWLYTL